MPVHLSDTDSRSEQLAALTAPDAASGRTVLDGAFSVLDALARADDGLGLTALARASGLAKTSAHRLTEQLVALGAVECERLAGNCAPTSARRIVDSLSGGLAGGASSSIRSPPDPLQESTFRHCDVSMVASPSKRGRVFGRLDDGSCGAAAADVGPTRHGSTRLQVRGETMRPRNSRGRAVVPESHWRA
jgi:hypothetical protein